MFCRASEHARALSHLSPSCRRGELKCVCSVALFCSGSPWFTDTMCLCLRYFSLSFMRDVFSLSVPLLVGPPLSSPPAAPWVQPDSLVTNPDLWLEKKTRPRPCLACFAPVALKQPCRAVHSAPGALALIAIPSLRSLLVNSSSHPGYHNRHKASLEVFIVVNVVKVLMGGIKSGAQIKYLLRISWKAFLKWLRDDMVVLEMSLSLLAQSKCGFIDKTNQEMCLSTESGILWI